MVAYGPGMLSCVVVGPVVMIMEDNLAHLLAQMHSMS